MVEGYYVKIFADMAVYLGLVPDGILEFISSEYGSDIKKNADLSNMEVSTIYLMQDIEDGCKAKCAFCVQSSESGSERRKNTLVDNALVRYPLKTFVEKIKEGLLEKKKIERICIQTVFNEKTAANLMQILSALKPVTNVPITACSIPLRKQVLIDLKDAGLDIITINYETATRELFDSIRGKGCGGPYRWEIVTESIDSAVDIYGKHKVGSHLQLGFGESHKDAFNHIQTLHDKGVFVSLFAFQPLKNTKLQDMTRISYQNFHKIQLGNYLVQQGLKRVEDFEFEQDGQVLSYGISENEASDLIETGIPFRNKGCPGCNRIYYETNPNERFYTYPRALTNEETARIRSEILG